MSDPLRGFGALPVSHLAEVADPLRHPVELTGGCPMSRMARSARSREIVVELQRCSSAKWIRCAICGNLQEMLFLLFCIFKNVFCLNGCLWQENACKISSSSERLSKKSEHCILETASDHTHLKSLPFEDENKGRIISTMSCCLNSLPDGTTRWSCVAPWETL